MRTLTYIIPLLIHFTTFSQTDFSWLEGTWKGPGFGGIMEEVWSAPDQKGNVMGMFRHLSEDGKVNFMEFWLLTKDGLKLKHFNADMTGWEEKDEFVDFKFVKSEENKLILQGLTYDLSASGKMKIALDMKRDEKVTTEYFELTKVKD